MNLDFENDFASNSRELSCFNYLLIYSHERGGGEEGKKEKEKVENGNENEKWDIFVFILF
jgi:hypothetical protein